jgi:hypothetical protein
MAFGRPCDVAPAVLMGHRCAGRQPATAGYAACRPTNCSLTRYSVRDASAASCSADVPEKRLYLVDMGWSRSDSYRPA